MTDTPRRPNDDLAERDAARDEYQHGIGHGHEEPTFEQIAAEAYAIYMSHGQEGRDLDDWLEAERRLTQRG